MRDNKIFHKFKLLTLNRFKLTVSARIPEGGLAQSLKKKFRAWVQRIKSALFMNGEENGTNII